jgi:integrase
MRKYAIERGIEPDSEFQAFHDWALSKGAKYVDWTAGWRTRINKALEFAVRASPSRNGHASRPSASEFLPHTFASLLLANGAPLTYVATELGHKGPATTLKYYAHWLPGGDKRWIDGLDRDAGTNWHQNPENPLRSLENELTCI